MVNFVNTDLKDIINLQNISQSYDDGRTWIIKDLNLLVEDKPNQGQFVIILGMSGCGKSTLLRYISNITKPTKGEVYIDEKLLNESNRVSMVFQQYSSLPWLTVLENVALGLKFKNIEAKEANKSALEMIELVGLKGQENKYAQYPTLSGGQLQRVAIARSLLSNPDILLMDEPFGALDIQTRLQMQDLLLEIWRKFKTTVVFVTHDISEAVYLGDDIYIMRAPPSQIVEHIHVDLPLNRTHEVKRSPRFNELVQEVEDKMIQVSKLK